MEETPSLLLVDDDSMYCQILVEYLRGMGYQLVTASDGVDALTILQERAEAFRAVILDRIMPRMDGIEMLKRMQQDPTLKHLPVIMQTGAGTSQEVREGIEAGAFYYLTKPFDQDVLIAIVTSALHDYEARRELQADLRKTAHSMSFLQSGSFRVKTLEEAHGLALMLANTCPDPGKVVMGLCDLMVNAIEHGNLKITFDEKTDLQRMDQWEAEIQRRSRLPEHAGKWVEVQFERHPQMIRITIKDQGSGFDWNRYLEMCPELAFSSHGRGIAMARALCFDHLEYLGVGNEVRCTIALDQAEGEKKIPVPHSQGVEVCP